MKCVKVEVVMNEEGAPASTAGTRFILPSGDAIPGVRRAVLVAEVNSVWTAHLELTVSPPEDLLAELGKAVVILDEVARKPLEVEITLGAPSVGA